MTENTPNEQTSRPLLVAIDDEEDIATFVAEVADRVGFDATHATNVADALKQVDQRPPAIIVSDICIPDVDGVELIGELDKRRCVCGLIFMSGYHGKYLEYARELAAASKIPVLATLEKPFRLSELSQVLQGALEWSEQNGRNHAP